MKRTILYLWLVSTAIGIQNLVPRAHGREDDGAGQPGRQFEHGESHQQVRFGAWGPPVNLGATINSTSDDQHPALSPNGLSLYISSNRPGGFGDFDPRVRARPRRHAVRAAIQPRSVINGAFADFRATRTPGRHWIYFSKPGECGATDLYRSYRDNPVDDFAWGPPENLGCLINSPQDDNGPTFFRDHDPQLTTMYFTSFMRSGGLGDWDIYASLLDPHENVFRRAALVAELSSSFRDTRTALRRDGLEIVLTSNRPGGVGGFDLWVSTRATTRDAWGVPVNLGNVVNSVSNEGAPAMSADGTTLIFYSNRP